jgi:large subunit ribosomal protein L30e
MELDKVIRNVLKTGRVTFGVNSALSSIKSGRAKAVILASNCPVNNREVIEHNCQTSRIPLIISDNSSSNLAILCGKPFAITVLSIRDVGDSNILQLVEEKSLYLGGDE